MVPTLADKQSVPIVVSGNFTAQNNTNYVAVATLTVTDPSPVEGQGFEVMIRNGTATIGGTAYIAGQTVRRVYHSGAWANYEQGELVQSASGITTLQAATQDAIRLLGRAGGTSSYVATLTPTTLTASRTYTFPDAAITVAGSASALTSGRVPYATTGGLLTDSSLLTFTGSALMSGNNSSASDILLNGPAGSVRPFSFQTAGVNRWRFYASSTAESGSDAGSPFAIAAYTDAGAFIDNAISIIRASGGAITLARPVTSTGVVTVPNGTAAAPGIRLTSEASGLYRIGSTSVGISVAGSLVLTVGSTASSFASGTTLAVSNTTASTSTTTGALTVAGGLGVVGALYTGGLTRLAVDAAVSTEAILLGSSSNTVTLGVVRNGTTGGCTLRGGTSGGAIATYGSTHASLANYVLVDADTLQLRSETGTTRASLTSTVLNVALTTASTSTTTGALTCAGGGAFAKELVTGLGLWLVDGQTAPGATSGYAKIYVDTADGDLKIIFGDGTIKTIVTDT